MPSIERRTFLGTLASGAVAGLGGWTVLSLAIVAGIDRRPGAAFRNRLRTTVDRVQETLSR